MLNLTPLQKAKLIAIFPDLQGYFDLEEIRSNANTTLADLVKKVNSLKPEKGEKGDSGDVGQTPIKGVDYFTDSEVKTIIEYVLKEATPVKGKDYKDGEDGKTPTKKELMSLIVPLIPEVEDGEDGVDGTNADLTPEEISTRLNTLKEAVDVSVIKGAVSSKDLKDGMVKIDSRFKTIDQRWHGGGLSKVSHDTTLAGDGTGSSPLSVVNSGSSSALPLNAIQLGDGTGGFKTVGGTVLDVTGNTRGLNALDLQTLRGAVAQVASGISSVVVGNLNTASGIGSMALGRSNASSGLNSLVVGASNNASAQSSTAVGNANTASAQGATAIGGSNTASGINSSAIGVSNTVSANSSHAFGQSLNISTANHVRIGYGVSTTWIDVEASGALTSAGLGSFMVSTNGTVTSDFFAGDGSQLTNIPYLAITGVPNFWIYNDPISIDGGLITSDGSGHLTAVSFIGDGQGLTNISLVAQNNDANFAVIGSTVVSAFPNDAGFIAGVDVPTWEQDPVYTTWYASGNPSLNSLTVQGLTPSKPVFTDGGNVLVSGLYSLAQIVAQGNADAQSAANSSVVTFTSPNDGVKHIFRVGAYTAITAISAGTLTVQFSFTDENNTARTLNFFPMGLTSASLTTTGFDSFPPATIRCKDNTAVTIKTTFTGVSITYDVGGTIELLN